MSNKPLKLNHEFLYEKVDYYTSIGDGEEALKILHGLASKKHLDSMVDLGNIFWTGEYIGQPNYTEAFRFYAMAAHEGSDRGMESLRQLQKDAHAVQAIQNFIDFVESVESYIGDDDIFNSYVDFARQFVAKAKEYYNIETVCQYVDDEQALSQKYGASYISVPNPLLQ